MQNLYVIKIIWELFVLFQKPLKPEALLMYREEMGPY